MLACVSSQYVSWRTTLSQGMHVPKSETLRGNASPCVLYRYFLDSGIAHLLVEVL